MNPVEIICESCEHRMKLSESLLDKIAGKTGRVTCRECATKIVLDATGDDVLVKDGGYVADPALELEMVSDFSELPPTADPHLSEYPEAMKPQRSTRDVSMPPPLPIEARIRRSMRAAQEPALEELAAAVSFASHDDVFEAPEPVLDRNDTLSPHSIGDDDDQEGLIPLGREFNSSPFASERDESFKSLYPQAAPKPKKAAPAVAPSPYVSKAPPPPKAGELRRAQSEPEIFADELGTAPAVAATTVELGPDGELLNLADKKAQRREAAARRGSFVPWTIAAIALLGFGVSASGQFAQKTPVVVQAPVKTVVVKETASAAAPAAEEEVPGLIEDAAVAEATAVADTAQAAKPQTSVEPKTVVAKSSPAKSEDVSAASAVAKGTTGKEEDTSASADAAADAGDTAEVKEEAPEEVQPALPPFSAAAAASSMREATALASGCRRGDDPTGYAQVVVTFAPSGRVTRASVSGPPFAGTETGGCIASRFRASRVPAFAGDLVTVTKTVAIR